MSTNSALLVLWSGSGGVRAESGDRKASRSMVTSVAFRGFVGVVKARLETRPTAGHVCTLDARLRRFVPLGRPRDNILTKGVDVV